MRLEPRRQRSPWLYVAIGCGLAVLLGVAAVVSVVWFTVGKVRAVETEMKDPQLRGDKVRAMLGAEELPPGYHPVIAFSVPFLMDTAILSDEPPGEGGEPGEDIGEGGIVYVATRGSQKDREELRQVLRGEGGRADILDRVQVGNLDLGSARGEALGRGQLEVRGVTWLWATHRGTVERGQRRKEGIQTMALAECPAGDDRLRMVIWFG
ncbi:MAG TPA: hypothetical protein VMT16_08025, partial [Thermoanaerobaculia bacterium]|nr:hypothetical protein [Thermoanaerobaculia bacterium]